MFGGDFFSQFAGRGGPEANEVPENVDNKKLYEVLELEPTATQDQIKASFRRLVKKHHPDKGGDANKFKEINAANSVLSDPEQKKIYDQYGLEGLNNSGGGAGMNDVFDLFFGGGRRRGGPEEKPKLKPKVMKVQVELDDIFKGKTINLSVQREKICIDCNGKGGSKVDQCSKCNGKGATIKMVQVGPGMYTQSQARCESCQGTGEIIEKDSQCKACKGKKTLDTSEDVEIQVPKGAPQGHQILIPEKGDQHYIYRTGDLVVLVEIKLHPIFKRIKDDLFITKKISLIEALMGFKFNVKKFDSEITISSPAGVIVNNKDIKLVKNQGLPKFNNNSEYGNLVIELLIEMPKKLLPNQIESLKTLLPEKILPPLHSTKLNYEFSEGPVIIQNSEHTHEGEEEGDEENENERGFRGGPGVQCQQQ